MYIKITDSLASTPQKIDLRNVLDRMSVSCGGHYAKSCKECHKGNGAGWCNGDCIWVDNKCKDKPKTTTTTTTKTTTKHKTTTTTTTTTTAKTTTKRKATTTAKTGTKRKTTTTTTTTVKTTTKPKNSGKFT